MCATAKPLRTLSLSYQGCCTRSGRYAQGADPFLKGCPNSRPKISFRASGREGEKEKMGRFRRPILFGFLRRARPTATIILQGKPCFGRRAVRLMARKVGYRYPPRLTFGEAKLERQQPLEAIARKSPRKKRWAKGIIPRRSWPFPARPGKPWGPAPPGRPASCG